MKLDSLDFDQVTVLTVNQRLSSWLVRRYEQERCSAGDLFWQSPDILPWNSWLQRCWSERHDCPESGSTSPALLSPSQAELVWQQIIASDSSLALMNPAATARLAASAWKMCQDWQLDVSGIGATDQPDTQAFIRWKQAFISRSRREGWIDPARLPTHLMRQFELDAIQVPNRLVLAGFDQLTPQQTQLLDALTSKGTQVERLELPHSQAKIDCTRFPDALTEIEHAARWARKMLEENPDERIGIVVPDLQNCRNAVERTFRRVFYPSACFATEWPEHKAYNLSLGQPLADFPLIEVALSALQLLPGKQAWQSISHLLRAGFWGADGAEKSDRARLEALIRETGRMQLSLQQLINFIADQQQRRPEFCDRTARQLQAFLAARQSWNRRQSTQEWARSLSRALSQLGWPGETPLQSEGYQTLQAWLDALQQFSSLSRVGTDLDLSEAIGLLSQTLRQTIYQPESAEAPIQIMGTLESAGQQFDALWVTGMGQNTFPAPPRPNPFVPLSLQRQAGVPGATTESAYQMAREQIQQWNRSARWVHYSWPAQVDGAAVSVTPLLKHHPVNEQGAAPRDDAERVLFEVARLETLQTDQAPALDHPGNIRGGVAVLRDQSACPFRAFARHRLVAAGLEEPQPGVDPRLRGSLVHQCLEAVWQELSDQQHLLALSNDARKHLIEDVVASVFQRQLGYKDDLQDAWIRIEHTRICGLLSDWLEVEAQRSPFSVLETEARQSVQVGALQLQVSVDRIDQLEPDGLLVVDYKTGDCRPQDWFGERPKDPQLPLYGCFTREGVRGLAFGRLKTGKMGWVGVADPSLSLSELKALDRLPDGLAEADWPAQQQSWRTHLERLADGFVHGDARVDPLPKACDYCDLDTLCRVQSLGEEGEEGTDDAS